MSRHFSDRNPYGVTRKERERFNQLIKESGYKEPTKEEQDEESRISLIAFIVFVVIILAISFISGLI